MQKNDWVMANRATQKWSSREQFARVIWGLIWPLFRFSPRPFWGWRRQILRLIGSKIAAEVHVYPSVQITMPWNLHIGYASAVGDRAILYALGPICIGNGVTISQGVHLCAGTHDYRDPEMPLLKLPITVGSDAWICADAFIGPGVEIGDRAIVGARAVVVRNVDSDSIVAGNPAQVIKKRCT